MKLMDFRRFMKMCKEFNIEPTWELCRDYNKNLRQKRNDRMTQIKK